MREILFRGKAINRKSNEEYVTNYKNGDWVYGFITKLKDKRYGSPAEMTNTDRVCSIEVDCDTIGQYTGVTDKNGTKIFEGDILQGDEYPYCSDGDYNYYAEVVWFDDGCCGFGLCTHKNPKSAVRGISDGNCEWLDDFDSDNWSVIGNIFDNPELITEQEENNE
jgi:uncharacterized phage protein (TIGR01671 family)